MSSRRGRSLVRTEHVEEEEREETVVKGSGSTVSTAVIAARAPPPPARPSGTIPVKGSLHRAFPAEEKGSVQTDEVDTEDEEDHVFPVDVNLEEECIEEGTGTSWSVAEWKKRCSVLVPKGKKPKAAKLEPQSFVSVFADELTSVWDATEVLWRVRHTQQTNRLMDAHSKLFTARNHLSTDKTLEECTTIQLSGQTVVMYPFVEPDAPKKGVSTSSRRGDGAGDGAGDGKKETDDDVDPLRHLTVSLVSDTNVWRAQLPKVPGRLLPVHVPGPLHARSVKRLVAWLLNTIQHEKRWNIKTLCIQGTGPTAPLAAQVRFACAYMGPYETELTWAHCVDDVDHALATEHLAALGDDDDEEGEEEEGWGALDWEFVRVAQDEEKAQTKPGLLTGGLNRFIVAKHDEVAWCAETCFTYARDHPKGASVSYAIQYDVET
jgi:hypothetical protein